MEVISIDSSEDEYEASRIKVESSDYDGAYLELVPVSKNGHCILNCFAEYFQEDIEFITDRLRNEILFNINHYDQFSELSREEIILELEKYFNAKDYNTSSVDLVLDALSKIYKCHIFVHSPKEPVIDLIGSQFAKELHLFKKGDHYDLLIDSAELAKRELLQTGSDEIATAQLSLGISTTDQTSPDVSAADYILEFLLLKPHEIEEKEPLKGVRYAKTYTIKDAPLEKITCDDNGAYIKHNNVKRNYFVELDYSNGTVNTQVVHEGGNTGYYFKERKGRGYINTQVPKDNIVALERYYCVSKNFPYLKRTIVRAKYIVKKDYEPYTFVIFTTTGEENDSDELPMLPHGNNKASTPYIRTSSSVLQEQDELLSTKTDTVIYDSLIKNSGGPFESTSASNEPRNVKQIQNRRAKRKSSESPSTTKNTKDELSDLLVKQQSTSVLKTITVTNAAYFLFVYDQRQLNDIVKFCCTNDPDTTTLAVDTTFNLCDLWITDTSYRNKRLINPKTKKHPVFLGPAMFHFTKDEDTFNRFALEILGGNPNIRALKQIGVDLEAAIYKGFKQQIPDLKRLICVRHLSKRDEKKLGKLLEKTSLIEGKKKAAKSEIIKDIYGTKNGGCYEFGLADAFDEDDLEIKLTSLEQKWESLCPGFYKWFVLRRKQLFLDSVIQSARQGTDVHGLYYQNDVESMHAVEKRSAAYQKKEISEIIDMLKNLFDRQEVEEVRALYGLGNYVLSAPYKRFRIEPNQWYEMTADERKDRVEKFRKYSPNISDSFRKPINAGRKPGEVSRKRQNTEPDIVIDRHESRTAQEGGLVIKLSKSPGSKQWKKGKDVTNNCDQVRFLDPRDEPPKEYELHLRSKLPKSVRSCQARCGEAISDKHAMVVRTYGTKKWTDQNTGETMSRYGPKYLHFQEKCLKNLEPEKYGFGDSFDYEKITVDTITFGELTEKEKEILIALKIKTPSA